MSCFAICIEIISLVISFGSFVHKCHCLDAVCQLCNIVIKRKHGLAFPSNAQVAACHNDDS